MFGETTYTKYSAPVFKKSLIKVVIVDDNFAVRNVIATIIQDIAKQNKLNIKIFTSEEGVQGLGYAFIIKPDILIIDATLPKYSGRELVDYLLSNPNFTPDNEHVLIFIGDRKKNLEENEKYLAFNKDSNDFIKNISASFYKILAVSQEKPTIPSRFRFFLSKQAIRWANRSDILTEKIDKLKFFLFRILALPLIIVVQYVSSLFLTLLRIFSRKIKDDNIDQSNQDVKTYRIRYYPSLFAAFTIGTILLLQITFSLGSVLFLFRGSEETARAASWYNSSWLYRKQMTIDDANFLSSAANFPISVRISSDTDLSTKAQSDADDILFTSSDGTTKIDHEIETYVSGTGQLTAWVEVPFISSSSDTIIYMYYGNSVASSQQNKTGTWTTKYGAVYHLNENPGGTAPQMKDSTTDPLDGTSEGSMTSDDSVTGKLTNALNFDGSNDRINMGTGTDLNFDTSDFSISFWVKNTLTTDAYVLSKGANGGGVRGYKIYLSYVSSNLRVGFRIESNSQAAVSVPGAYTSPLNNGSWNMVFITFDRNANATVYINGSSVATASISNVDSVTINSPDNFYLGRQLGGAPYYTGDMDEVRLYNTLVSANEVAAEYATQNSLVYSVGSQETEHGLVTATFGTKTTNAIIGGGATNMGGGFAITSTSGSSDLTSVTLTESGTIDAAVGLDDIAMYYEYDTTSPYNCESEAYNGTESQLGATDTNGFSAANGTSLFTAAGPGIIVSPTQTICLYVIYTVTTSAAYGSTVNIGIANPSTNVTFSSGITAPTTSVTVSGTTTAYPPTIVASFGTQTTSFLTNSTNKYIGGGFSFTSLSGTRNVTLINLLENGTINASTGLDNIKLLYDLDTSAPYDCASESYSGSESQFGSTDTDGFSDPNGYSSFSGSVEISTTKTLCVYVVMDFVGNISGTLEIEINDPPVDVSVSSGTIGPVSMSAQIAGTTTVASYLLEVSSLGTQTTELGVNNYDKHIGGAFVMTNAPGDTSNVTVTSIKLTESGTIDAQNDLDNISLFYELDVSSPYNCASESYGGSETAFGNPATSSFNGANGTVTISGTATLTGGVSALCFYVVVDLTNSADNGNTIEVGINNPNTDVVVTGSVAAPDTAINISGTTTVNDVAWYNGSWSFRKLITIDHTKVTATNWHRDFVMLVNISSDTSIRDNAQTDGDDILFTEGDGVTKLNHEIEKYTSSNGQTVAWIRMPKLYDDRSTYIYIYYGNSGATAQENETGTWSSSIFKGVWHMAEDPSGTAPQINDSSSSSNNGTSSGSMTNTDLVTGLLGDAINFDGSNDGISMGDPANGSLDIGTEDFSVTTWVRTTTSTSMHYFGKGASGQAGYRSYLNGSLSSRPGFTVWGSAAVDSTPGAYSHSLLNGNWHNITITADRNGSAVVYIDGSQVASFSIAAQDGQSLANTQPYYIGRYNAGAYWNGDIDEHRLVNGLLSAGWISTEFQNYNTPSTFYSINTTEVNNLEPTVTSVSLNGGSDITLTENTTTTVEWTATVTDLNGYADISTVSGKLYRSGVTDAENCTTNDNNCYSDASCNLSGCSGNSCTATCSVSMQFHADPTDSGAPFEAQYWRSFVLATDAASDTGSAFSPTDLNEVNTLLGLSTTASINYGVLAPNSDSGTTNQIIVLTNTGNTITDIEVYGTDLCTDFPTCSGNIIEDSQYYQFDPFNVGLGEGIPVGAVPTTEAANIAKPTASPSNGTVDTYWGIIIPTGIPSGSYTGLITINAIGDT